MDPTPSDAIYKELLRLNSEDIKILGNFKNILNITEIEVDCLETYDVLNLSSFSLKSLTLKNFANLRLKFPDRERELEFIGLQRKHEIGFKLTFDNLLYTFLTIIKISKNCFFFR